LTFPSRTEEDTVEGRPVVVEGVVDEATVVVGTSGPEVVVADSPLLAGMEAAAVVVPALEVAVAATVGVTEAELQAVAPATGGRLSSPIPARQDRRLLPFLASIVSHLLRLCLKTKTYNKNIFRSISLDS
jgi:hypothetical protein